MYIYSTLTVHSPGILEDGARGVQVGDIDMKYAHQEEVNLTQNYRPWQYM